MRIDLNADLGEGMDDSEILPFVSSANIACGMHAGDPELMDRTVALALDRGVQVGAHPGYADRANFGRFHIQMPLEAVENLVLYQVAALDGFVRSRQGTLRHVKPHGALYNQAAKDVELARAIARGVQRFRPSLILVGLAGSKLIQAAKEVGLAAAEEAFADRRYLPDGSLMHRQRPGAVLTNPEDAGAQAALIATEGCVIAEGGSRLPVRADTLCLHGDTPGASTIASVIRERLGAAGVSIAPLSSKLG